MSETKPSVIEELTEGCTCDLEPGFLIDPPDEDSGVLDCEGERVATSSSKPYAKLVAAALDAYMDRESNVCLVHRTEQVAEERFDFGEAIRRLKNGERVSRAGWNGKGMWLAYQAGYPDGIPINANTARATGIAQGTVCQFLPYIMMRTVDGSFVPWLASQTDLLAEDWVGAP